MASELEQIADRIVAVYKDNELSNSFTLVGAFNFLKVPLENRRYLKKRIKHKQKEIRQARKQKEEDIKERDREWWDDYDKRTKG